VDGVVVLELLGLQLQAPTPGAVLVLGAYFLLQLGVVLLVATLDYFL
jgi:hypothetical protein